ncbi:MAG: outer membrane lipoprotein-sorting protein [bacterium]|nr:outer membrane lipoprotein-sorting protein [bacterium]
MHRIYFSFLTIIIVLFGLTGISAADDPAPASSEPVGTEGAGLGLTATQMIAKMRDFTRGTTSHGIMTMEVVTPDWNRSVQMEWWEKGEEKFLIRVLSPARDEGNGTLKIGNNLWNYIYAFDETVHIPPAMMAQAWMGSDFTNDDIVRDSSLVEDYRHALEGIEEINGERCYKILLTTDPSTPVPWLMIRIWTRVSDLLPVREEYYDDNGNVARYMDFSEFKYMSDRVTPTVMRMVPVDQEGRYTEMTYNEIEFDIDLLDEIFTEQNLTNP